jgi:monoamine oxidase
MHPQHNALFATYGRKSISCSARLGAEIDLSRHAARAFSSRPSTPEQGHRDPRVAIVGAGIAGLSAALTLTHNGIRPTVYECSERVGGRMRSRADGYWSDGQTSEWCGELIDSDHTAIRALAQAFDLTLTDLLAAEPPGSSDTFFFNGEHYPRARAEMDFRPVREALQRDLDAAGSQVTWSTATEAAARLDEMSVYDWIESRVPDGHRSPMGRLLDTAYGSECAADTTDQSALNIVYVLGAQPDAERFSILGGSDERFRIDGGNEQLAAAIAERLPEPVRLGWRLDAVRALADGRLRLVFDERGSTREVVAEHVVLALPFAVLRTLDCEHAGFDERKRAVIEELGTGRSAKLALQFRERHWSSQRSSPVGSGASLADTGYMSTWEATRGQTGAAGILVSFMGGAPAGAFAPSAAFSDAGNDTAVDDYARRFLAQIEPVFPGIGACWNGKATLSVPMLDSGFRCSYPYYRVGQHHRFAGYERLRAGNIHFAGDHCSGAFQGFMEGAATEGYRAAREILEDH